MTLTDLHPIAHHEAGHVVAFYVLVGQAVESEIWPCGMGHTHGALYGARHTARRLAAELVVSIAGPVAQARAMGVPAPSVYFDRIAAGDRARYWEHHEALRAEHGASIPFASSWRAAMELVEDQWHRITAIAAELMSRGFVSAARVRSILAWDAAFFAVAS